MELKYPKNKENSFRCTVDRPLDPQIQGAAHRKCYAVHRRGLWAVEAILHHPMTEI